jgi:hypothetical protein
MSFFSKLLKPKATVSAAHVIENIDYKGGTKYATDHSNVVYLDIEELGGFPFIKSVIIGDFSTRIKRKGCTLTFNFKDESITLESDNNTIESNRIKNTEAFYTEIDFELNPEEEGKIKSRSLENITYKFNGKAYPFSLVK